VTVYKERRREGRKYNRRVGGSERSEEKFETIYCGGGENHHFVRRFTVFVPSSF
jgi:hypothetical protein